MKLKDVGERYLLDLARKICEKGPPVDVGIGDDGAVIEFDEGPIVTTTDMIIEGIHFRREAPIHYLSSKAVVTNLSDLAAMGAEPLGLIFSIGAPSETEVEFISELLEGMNSAAREYGASVVGGDLNEAKQIIISGAAIGGTGGRDPLLRSGAENGDIIGLTGELGATAAAIDAMKENISLEGKNQLKEALFEPTARVGEGRVLSKSEQVTSAIDITDGLASNLWQISRMSEVGLVIEDEKLPISPSAQEYAEERGKNLDDFVFSGGEEFELLFTVRPEAWEDLETEIRELGTKISKIGKVNSKEGVFLKRGGEIEELPDRGYEHFK